MKFKTLVLFLVLFSAYSAVASGENADNMVVSALTRLSRPEIKTLYNNGATAGMNPTALAELALRLDLYDEAARHLSALKRPYPAGALVTLYKKNIIVLEDNDFLSEKDLSQALDYRQPADHLLYSYINYAVSQRLAVEPLEEYLALPDAGIPLTDRLDALNLLTECYAFCGYFDKARACCRRFENEVNALCAAPSRYHHLRLIRRSDIALKEGDYGRAAMYADSAAVRLAQSGETAGYDYAAVCELQGDIAMFSGNYSDAEKHLLQAAAIYRACGLDNRVTLVETKISDVYILQNKLDESDALITQLGNREWPVAFGGAKGYMGLMANHGELLLLRQQPLAAKMIYASALDLGKSIEQTDFETELRLLAGAGYACIKNDSPAEAIAHFSEQLEKERQMAHDQFVFMPESKRGAYWAHADTRMRRLFSANREGTVTMNGGKVVEMPKQNINASAGLLYDAALLHKGLLLESSAALRKALDSNNDPAMAADAARLTALREKIAASPAPDAAMSATADSLEQILLESSPDLAGFMNFTSIRWRDVREALADDEMAIEFVCSADNGTEYYSAELLRHDWEQPRHIFLFSTREGKSPFGSDGAYSQTGIYRRIWRRIIPYLNEHDRIWFSAAGCLHGTAIEYAMMPDSTRLYEHYTPMRLSSTRRLTYRQPQDSRHTATVFGGLNYNTDLAESELYAADATDKLYAVRGADRTGLGPVMWRYLPGTLAEVHDVSAAMTGAGYKVALFEGDEGVESAFKQLAGVKPGIIHIATHGFFNPAPLRRDNFIANAYEDDDAALYRCGLVMSGANSTTADDGTSGGDDGILTAKEIAALDLEGTDLVVMSACSTGLGRISGDGVFGLQRAFKLAGAQSIVMSLWPVHDDATRLLMTAFYRSLIAGQSRHQALASAQSAVRHATFEVDGTVRSGDDPYFWAAFILLD